ncbi:hypothetical protein UAJ10_14495 [Nitrospirillum sp. BR 11164]|uniref:hypothetical protein n=1 Tax=Nitrospirillum sp. BR 11164 TaxID=3104324 RepID=UPI002AFF02C0|nr:hypothetical protein [Nitrospirillum sp. BR 11164]MEA1650216.1 hypothetical protein [Nitrospirillum sp. BR 11164]
MTTISGGAGNQALDFANMSRSQMMGAANSLYRSGQITLDQMGKLEMMGPLGKVGPGGQFQAFTAQERASLDSQPVNYIDQTRKVIAGIEQRGDAANPQSGYQDWKQLLLTMQEV